MSIVALKTKDNNYEVATTLPLLSFVEYPIDFSFTSEDLERLKKRIVIKRAIEARLVDADRITKAFR